MTVCDPKARLRSAVNQRILPCNIRISGQLCQEVHHDPLFEKLLMKRDGH